MFTEASSRARLEAISAALPPALAEALPHYLEGSANPDLSLFQLEILLQRFPDECRAAFAASALALHACVALFGSSPWLTQSLMQNLDLLHLFARRDGLRAPRAAEDLREQFARFHMRHHQAPISVVLARFKRREYIRIFVRELLGLGPLPEIIAEISALADVLIEQALVHCESQLRSRFLGWPQVHDADGRLARARFCVLSLGKLGGEELNYSSDIDLMFLCDDSGDAGTVAIPAREFFTRLAQDVTAVLSNVGVEGQPFRVDLRLRPQGASGEVVTGLAQAVRYYQQQAHDWELQALLKMRCSAGDASLAREFAQAVDPLIYHQELSLSAIQTAARSLDRIRRGTSRQSGGGTLDVKSGPGGIREIEFTVQCLQRVHGGRDPWVRSGGTLAALQKLHDKSLIAAAEFRELYETYRLLRCLEHRLQCRQGLAMHRLPASAQEQRAFFRSLVSKKVANARELRARMDSASSLCARVLTLGGEESGSVPLQDARLGTSALERLSAALALRSPRLAQVLDASVGDAALRSLHRFLSAAATDEARLASTVENAALVERALPVFASSALATDLLARYPSDISALFAAAELDAALPISDRLRLAARRALLRNIGATILDGQSVWEALGEYSRAFQQILSAAVAAVDPPEGFAVFGLGRLGTRELDALSDVDLLFLRSPACDPEAASHCARELVTLLSGYTREGSVVAADVRLRPHGEQGELVSSVRQFAQYCEAEAQPWEAIAYAKLVFVAGDAGLVAAATEAVNALRRRWVAAPDFAAQLSQTRRRIEGAAGAENFKAGPGGLYDLDYILGLLEARADVLPEQRQMRNRLHRLVELGTIPSGQGSALQSAAHLIRRLDHANRIVEGRSRRWLPQADAVRATVERLAGGPNLEPSLRREMLSVRALYHDVFQD
ncbi:MAG: hypothetical protein P4M01_13820 [Acidobacteriota bacterium]|nr:hypothetical protein [Acidobacteriota bacterium]